ncbi:MAG: hypothetical protein ACREQC_00775, partial [Candidatus Binataceae bacterium]
MNRLLVEAFARWSGTLTGEGFRRLVRRANRYQRLPLEFRVAIDADERAHYTYCVYHAARLARRLNLTKMAVVEFGVAGGNGLIFLEGLAPEIRDSLGIDLEIYGFDSAQGLPPSIKPEDLPYAAKAGSFKMDLDALRARLALAKLVIGDVKETVPGFFQKFSPAPVGVVLIDLDLYTPTTAALQLLAAHPQNFLPRVFCYFDDITGNEVEMFSECNGELLAISEFNRDQKSVYLGLNRNLLAKNHVSYRYSIYHA